MMIPIPKGRRVARGSWHRRGGVRARYHGRRNIYSPATVVTPLPEGNAYLGFIFARAEIPAPAEAALRAAHARLRFDIAPLLPIAR